MDRLSQRECTLESDWLAPALAIDYAKMGGNGQAEERYSSGRSETFEGSSRRASGARRHA